MKVTLWAHSVATDALRHLLAQQNGATDADHLHEAAGRSCFQSWGRPNPATADTGDYLANIIDSGHESVLAHGSATFYLEDVSRSLTHELIRHRYLAVSELSQRYVAMGDSYTVVPPLWRHTHAEAGRFAEHHAASVKLYEELVAAAQDRGVSRKEARQAARAVLPGGTETRIVVSGNYRAWRDFIKQRHSPHADAEIREVAGELLRQLSLLAPGTFQDLTEPATNSS